MSANTADVDAETDPTNVHIAVIGGGSRDWGNKLLKDLALTTEIAGEVSLYDLDQESAELNARLGRTLLAADEATGEWEYTVKSDLGRTLDGADFVIISVQDPPSETFKHDLDIPKEYGIYQSVGDTVGPGGTLRGLRAVPTFTGFAAAIRDHCPEAWVINYTNPMTVCTRALYEEFPAINAFGVCHEVYGTQRYLAELVAKHLNVERPARSEIDVNIKGINHFTWLDEIRWNGHDLFEVIDEELAAQQPLPHLEPGALSDEGTYVDRCQITLDLYRRFGIFPAAGDRHLAEFVPWYLEDEPRLHCWGIRLTPSETRTNKWPKGDRSRRERINGERELDLSPSSEETVQQLKALLGFDSEFKTNVNLPNRGQVATLPHGPVVETNAVLGADSLKPVTAGSLPRGVRNLVSTHVENQETIIEAGVTGDIDLGFQAFLNDPLVTVDMESARAMFAELVETERKYLTAYDLDDSAVLADSR